MKRNLEARDTKGNEGRPEACSAQGCSCGRRDFLRKGPLVAGAAAVGSTSKFMVSVKYRTAPMDIRGHDWWRAKPSARKDKHFAKNGEPHFSRRPSVSR